jgi:hypothetical protein
MLKMINAVLLCLINGILEIAKNSQRYATRENEINTIVTMLFSSPLRLYHALIRSPIAILLKKKQRILTGVLLLTMSAKIPLVAKMIQPEISGHFASINNGFDTTATIDDIIKNINEAKETIDIFFITNLKNVNNCLQKA